MKTQYRRTVIALLLLVTGCATTGSSSRFGSLSDSRKRRSKDEGASSAERANGASGNSIASADSRSSAAMSASTSQTASNATSTLAQSLEQGTTALANNRVQEAKLHFERVLSQDPANVEAHHKLAIVADQFRQFDLAQTHYQAALKGDPKNPDILSDVGFSSFLQEKYAQSEKYLLEAIRHDPNHLRALNNLGLLYAKQGDYERALAKLRQAGTEEQAQARIAKLFPNGRPGSPVSNPFNKPGQQASPQGFASSPTSPGGTGMMQVSHSDQLEPLGAVAALAFGDEPRITPRGASPSTSPGEASPFESVQQISTANPMPQSSSPAGLSPWGQAPRSNSSTPAIPDASINQRFAEIDSRPSSSGQSLAIRPRESGPTGDSSQGVAPLWGGSSHMAATLSINAPQNQNRSEANPLDSMPLWDPGAANADRSIRSAAAEFPADSSQIGSAPIRQLGNFETQAAATGAMPPQWPHSPQAIAQSGRPEGQNSVTGQPAFGGMSSQAAGGNSAGSDGNALDSATRAAARLGLAAGPGQMFPVMGTSSERPTATGMRDAVTREAASSYWPITQTRYGTPAPGSSNAPMQFGQPAGGYPTAGSRYQTISSEGMGDEQDVRTADWSSSWQAENRDTAVGNAGYPTAGSAWQQGDMQQSANAVVPIPDTDRYSSMGRPMPPETQERLPAQSYGAIDTNRNGYYGQSTSASSYDRTASSEPSAESSGSGYYPWPR